MDLEFSVLKNRLQERMMADNVSDADLKGWNLADMTKVTLHTMRTAAPCVRRAIRHARIASVN